jgi:NADH-quinone oxidoreductase subunit I
MARLFKPIEPLLQGLGVTARHITRRKVTVQYPEQRRQLPKRFRGRLYLRRWDNGLERCVGCSLCAGACPAEAIYVEPGMNTEENRVSPGERYAAVYKVNMLRCIFCGYCVEACPVRALGMTDIFELSDYSRGDFIYDKERLLEPTANYYEKEDPSS